jgi:hypothetical protein
MAQISIVKELDKKFVIGDKCTCNIGVLEAFIWHGKLVYAEGFVHVKFLSLNDFGIPTLFSKNAETKFTVIKICNRVFITCGILFDFF